MYEPNVTIDLGHTPTVPQTVPLTVTFHHPQETTFRAEYLGRLAAEGRDLVIKFDPKNHPGPPTAPPPCKPAPANAMYNDCTMKRANVGP